MCRLFCIMILMVVVINGKPQGHSPTNTDDNVKFGYLQRLDQNNYHLLQLENIRQQRQQILQQYRLFQKYYQPQIQLNRHIEISPQIEQIKAMAFELQPNLQQFSRLQDPSVQIQLLPSLYRRVSFANNEKSAKIQKPSVDLQNFVFNNQKKSKIIQSTSNPQSLNVILPENIPIHLENINNGAIFRNNKPLIAFNQILKTTSDNNTSTNSPNQQLVSEKQVQTNSNSQTNTSSKFLQALVPTFFTQTFVPVIPAVAPAVVPADVQTEQPIETPTTKREKITLILEPHSKAIAGLNGTAIASPYSRAVLDEDVDIDVFYNPEAIAIAGPGGIAHAQSELEVGYFKRTRKSKKS